MRNCPLSSETAKYGLSRTTIQARMCVWASQTTSTTPGFLIRCVMSTTWSLVGSAMLKTVRRSRKPWVLCRIGSEFRIRTFAPDHHRRDVRHEQALGVVQLELRRPLAALDPLEGDDGAPDALGRADDERLGWLVLAADVGVLAHGQGLALRRLAGEAHPADQGPALRDRPLDVGRARPGDAVKPEAERQETSTATPRRILAPPHAPARRHRSGSTRWSRASQRALL